MGLARKKIAGCSFASVKSFARFSARKNQVVGPLISIVVPVWRDDHLVAGLVNSLPVVPELYEWVIVAVRPAEAPATCRVTLKRRRVIRKPFSRLRKFIREVQKLTPRFIEQVACQSLLLRCFSLPVMRYPEEWTREDGRSIFRTYAVPFVFCSKEAARVGSAYRKSSRLVWLGLWPPYAPRD